ncbi:unnamed protein product [Lactuca virosa]|uniref:Uncharacterized protein n=1 Tax=Lactuca virosa TaxID=75947 RepID=A0AAU9PJP0_9ASTR|nr:unnamed protein product [Lactuca virosa]
MWILFLTRYSSQPSLFIRPNNELITFMNCKSNFIERFQDNSNGLMVCEWWSLKLLRKLKKLRTRLSYRR